MWGVYKYYYDDAEYKLDKFDEERERKVTSKCKIKRKSAFEDTVKSVSAENLVKEKWELGLLF